MGYSRWRERGTGSVYSCCPASDTYTCRPYQYRVQKSRQVLRASHPNIRLIPKQYYSMQGISNIWVIEKGFANGKAKPDIKLKALWSPEYTTNIIHESAVKHLPRQATEVPMIFGRYRVSASLDLDWANSDHPEKNWITRYNRFYVTDQEMPQGVKAIIGSQCGSESPETNASNIAAPIHCAVTSSRTKQELERQEAEARARREAEKQAREAKIEREYQRLRQEQQQQQQQQRQTRQQNRS